MGEPTGLLAHKKEWPRHSISDAAVSLFLERGFDRASVNHVAAAAVISKPTPYRHSPPRKSLRCTGLRTTRRGRTRRT
jgi:hypothetical protein